MKGVKKYSKYEDLYVPYHVCLWDKVSKKDVHDFIDELMEKKY